MSDSPLVSVLMPAHNGERYLAGAIDSILAQTLRDFELIVVDDGSTDRTPEILDRYARRDSRVRVHRQENQGIPAARNQCLDLATGRYLAWMDSDDVALPARLQKQVAFMDAHPEIGVCGTWVKTIGAAAGQVWRYPTDDATLRSVLVFNPPFANTSTVVRREALEAAGLRFDLSFPQAQDYDLWARAAQHTRLANLPEALVLYRLHPRQVTETRSDNQVALSGKVRARELARLGLAPTAEEFELHQRLSQFTLDESREALTRAERWLQRLLNANEVRGAFPQREFASVVGQRWFFACRGATRLGRWTWRKYWSSPLSRHYTLRGRTRVKFFVYSYARLRS
ncbi:MAG: glycosyltransferase family 2 protein [Chloroflexi bacterium]|nr:glycosyltransferase family 2 protein [Chloroflexota bacterium]